MDAPNGRPPPPTADDLFKARSHPLRARLLDMLDGRVASPAELAPELDAPLANVAYHMRVLASCSCVQLVRQAQKRGAMEHFYTSTVGGLRVIPEVVLDLHSAYVVEGISVRELAARSGLEPGAVVTLFATHRLGVRSSDRVA